MNTATRRMTRFEKRMRAVGVRKAIEEEQSRRGTTAIDLGSLQIRDVDFDVQGMDLSGIKFNAEPARANFKDCTLVGANFSFRYTGSAKYCFDGADLTDANLEKLSARGASFVNAKMHRTNLAGAYLCEANFSGADFAGACFYDKVEDEYSEGSCLWKSNFRGGNFEGVYGIEYAVWAGAMMEESTRHLIL